ncbi:MAG: response regulator [Candidatus Acidiferrum sp.]
MRILVVDDHEVVRKGIRTVLAADSSLTLCGEAMDGRDAIEKTSALHPNVVIMDLTMPNLNGLEATRQIRRLHPDTEVLVLTQHDGAEMVRQAMHAGARGYLVKSAISSDLLKAIAKVANHESFVSDGIVASSENHDGTKETSQNDGSARSDVKVGGLAAGSSNAAQQRIPEENWPQHDDVYRAISEAIDYGIWVCDAEGGNIFASPAFLELVGRTAEEWCVSGWNGLLAPEEVESTKDGWQGCVREGKRWERDLRVRGADGNWHDVLSRGAPIRDAQGKIIYWGGIHLNIQERKDVERQRRQLVQTLEAQITERNQELETAADKLRELSGKLLQTQDEERRRIARELHDGVGQLLAALNMNLAELKKEKRQLSAHGAECLSESNALLEQALQETRTMSHLLHPPLLDEVGLESALRWYVDGFAERSGIEVQMRLPPGFSEGLPREMALTLFRIVQECLTNVHRHAGSATAVVSINRTLEKIVVEVADQGRGVPPEICAGIASGASSGVGLRGARERIRQFGGHLEVYSEQGTRVVAVLPMPGGAGSESPREEHGDVAAIAADPEQAPQNSVATILCIDDEASGLLPRRLLLESAGYRVIEARSGPEGIRIFRTEKVDAVILDYWMSGMKGTTVASELKRIHPAVPIIVLSGMADLPGEAAGLVDKWFMKGSHRAEELLDSISTLLERRTV